MCEFDKRVCSLASKQEYLREGIGRKYVNLIKDLINLKVNRKVDKRWKSKVQVNKELTTLKVSERFTSGKKLKVNFSKASIIIPEPRGRWLGMFLEFSKWRLL